MVDGRLVNLNKFCLIGFIHMMRNIFFSIIFCLVFCTGLLSPAAAGQVTLNISTTTGVVDGRLEAEFTVSNQGTEAAYQVYLQGRFEDEQQRVFIADQIKPGESASAIMGFEFPEDYHGVFPLYVTANYEHGNGTEVSSGSLAVVKSGKPAANILNLKLVREQGTRHGMVTVQLETRSEDFEFVTVTGHIPDDLDIEPRIQQVLLADGKGEASFKVINISGNPGSTYGIFVVAEYRIGNVNHLATGDLTMPVTETWAAPSTSAQQDNLRFWLTGLVILLALALAAVIIMSRRAGTWLFRLESVPFLLDICVLAAIEIFIFSKFDLGSLVSATTTTGGDTASHYYTLDYLRHTLLPAGRVSGWTMGNYAGFPILQFYFPLPFLVMCLLGLAMPLQVAFKVVSLLGTGLLPVAAYLMLRFMRNPFPGPAIGAVFMLPFLFNGANSMWGGNILSTLAGEFSYSFSMALSLILIGSLYQGARDGKGVIRNGLLVFLVGFSHGYTLLFAEAMSLFLLITPYGFVKRAVYLFKVYALGFCLLAFWLVPLLVFTRFTTSYHLVWTLHSFREVVPEILLPFMVAGAIGAVLLLIIGIATLQNGGRELLSKLFYILFGLATAVVFFVAAPRIGVVDIRYVPYGQLMACLLAALAAGSLANRYLGRRRQLHWLLLIVVAAATMHWTDSRVGSVNSWAKWNYDGFEKKNSWPLFQRINGALAGSFQDPRVVFEHSGDHNLFGSSRAFESLPLFAGRATLEGLYMQASISAPFIFYIQSEVSQVTSQPFPQYSYTSMDFNRAGKHLELFNVRDLIIRSSGAKQAIRQAKGYRLKETINQYELWELTTNRNRYVEPLEYEPVLFQGQAPWKEAAYQWFVRDAINDVHLVFGSAEDTAGFPGSGAAASLDEIPRLKLAPTDCEVSETIGNDEILIETSCLNRPLLVKVSYHPNWQVEGAAKIYLTSPSFMLIYPEESRVRLYYGPGKWDRFGFMLTLLGIVALLLNIPLPASRGKTAWSLLCGRSGLQDFMEDFGAAKLRLELTGRTRWTILLVVLAAAAVTVAAVSYRTYVDEPYRVFNRSVRFKDARQYEKARQGFRIYMDAYPMAGLARDSAYYIAISYYLEKKDARAIEAFEELIRRFPQSSRVPESYYHIGLSMFRSDREQEGIETLKLLRQKFPGTEWARYARERLSEHNALQEVVEPIDINKGNLDQYLGKAISYFNRDRLEKAKPILFEISQNYPEFAGAPQALAVLALCYYKQDDCETTIRFYRQLTNRYPEHQLVAEAYYHLGICYERTGKPKMSKVLFKKALDNYPESIYGRQAADRLLQ